VAWGTCSGVKTYAVGFARPDRWVQSGRADQARPWHAVEAHRPVEELDGEVELAVCGAIVQVWGWQKWDRVATGRTACAECVHATAGDPLGPPARTPRPATSAGDVPRLRIVS
jgi:hypothetical protein